MAKKSPSFNSKTSLFDSQVFNKGMVKDYTDIYIDEGMWTHAINAINNSHYGETGSIGNEPSNKLCTSAPNTIIGFANILHKKWVVFSTDGDLNHEIGLFNEGTCSYTRICEGECLNFSQDNLIKAVVKENYDCTYSVYFQDNSNPDRFVKFHLTLPTGATQLIHQDQLVCTDVSCADPVCTTDIDCDEIRLHPLVKQPCVSVDRAQGSGQLNNGSYIACVAYSEKGIKLTDYCTPSIPQPIWDHTGIGGGIEINITDLDERYDEYELVVISVINQQTIAKKIGYYSTDQTKVTLDIINPSLETIPLSEIPLKASVYEKSEGMFAINDYLIRTGMTTQPFINYQPLANQISSQWVVTQYPYEYYRDGGNNVGYMRDEVYAFFIRWVYKTGTYSHSYHIPGRPSTSYDTSTIPASNLNVVEAGHNKAWQVYDTSSVISTAQYDSPDGKGTIIARGSMGYWESTEQYPSDEPAVWNATYVNSNNINVGGTSDTNYDLCGKKIRHHKMPSNETTHIHDDVPQNYPNEFKKINVLGVRFTNIKHPVDEYGVPIKDIVGYEILRGSREGNRSIVAKGMFNNMRVFPYDSDTSSNTVSTKFGLYQNYPYNDLRRDVFLSKCPSKVNEGDAEGSAERFANDIQCGLTAYRQDYFSFHSPETVFIRPYLGSGSHVKVYTTEKGLVVGQFKHPYKHPRHVLITDFSFVRAMLMGIGVGLVDAIGKTSTSGVVGASFIVSTTQTGGRAVGNTGSGGIADTISGAVMNLFGIAGMIGGGIGFVFNFMYWVGKAADSIMEIQKNLLNPRQYALQYNSYGVYNQYQDVGRDESSYPPSYSRPVADNGLKYIGRGVQAFDESYRINNLYRNKFVCVKLGYPKTSGISKDHTLPDVPAPDNTRQRLADLATQGIYHKDTLYKHPTRFTVHTTTAAYYGAIKFHFDNQYGQIRSIVQMPIGSCIYNAPELNADGSQPDPNSGITYSTSVMHGGDTYINRYTEKNPFLFFNTWLFDLPDSTEFDYRHYINGPLPRYWANFEPFKVDDFAESLRDLFDNNSQEDMPDDIDPTDEQEIDDNKDGIIAAIKDAGGLKEFIDEVLVTPSDFHRLDRPNKISGVYGVKDSYFYLFYNGIRDFYCESELNMAFRDWGEGDDEKFYDIYHHSFADRDYLFRSDKIHKPIYLKYDLSLSASKLFNNFATWSTIPPRDYNPELYSTCFDYFPRRAIYSLQQVEGLKRDNWKNFLALNYRDFKGKVSTIKALNETGAVILFEDAEPVLFSGVDTLQTAGNTKLAVGDAGLFSDNNIQGMVNADDALGYASCISSRSAVNTPHGLFWISQDAGKIMQYSGQIDEISRYGMKFWFAENLPSWHRENDPTYTMYDNPVAGTGCQAVYDPTYELVYFSKKGYIPLTGDIYYDSDDGVPYTLCDETVPDAAPAEASSCVPSCPAGYSEVDGECTLVTTTSPEWSGSTMNVINGDTNPNFGSGGIYVLEDISGFSFPIVGGKYPVNNYILKDDSGTVVNNMPLPPGAVGANALWGNGTSYNGRLNSAGIWASGYPAGNEFCFTFCVDVAKSGQYLIGIAGDNEVKMYIDDVLYLHLSTTDNTVSPPSPNQAVTKPYNRWWVVPVNLAYGTRRIRLCGLDLGGNAYGFAAEVYSLTLNDLFDLSNNLLDASSGPIDLLPWIEFTTYDYRPPAGITIPNPADETGAWMCGDVEVDSGDVCANESVCGSIDIQPLIPCVSCTLTASELIVEAGTQISLTWTSVGAATLGMDSNFGIDARDYNGTSYVTVTENTIYWIEVTDDDGNTSVCSVEIQIKCPCDYSDGTCFDETSWTVSYDPKSKTWVSFHDWIPDLVMPSTQHFLTIKDAGLWQHNDRYDDFCRYYDTQYAWEVEYPLMTPGAVSTLRNLEYTMEAYVFDTNGKDYYHVLDENFNQAVIYNSEQISGLLDLQLKGKNTPSANLNYPRLINIGVSEPYYSIHYSKEENKYRFSQFWDITSERGEFVTNPGEMMWDTAADGVHRSINQSYVDYSKSFTQRKKFRHYGNRVILRKLRSFNKKMILKVVNSKHLLSSK